MCCKIRSLKVDFNKLNLLKDGSNSWELLYVISYIPTCFYSSNLACDMWVLTLQFQNDAESSSSQDSQLNMDIYCSVMCVEIFFKYWDGMLYYYVKKLLFFI